MTQAANLSALGSNVTTSGNLSSASTLTLQTNSTTAVTIDTSQKVGIGSTSPSTKLEIAAPNVSGRGQLSITANNGAADTAQITLYNGTNEWGQMYCNSTNMVIGSVDYLPLNIRSAGTTAMWIDINQNVGIGNSGSGTYKLYLTGSGTTRFGVADTGGTAIAKVAAAVDDAYFSNDSATGKIIFQTNSTQRVQIDGTGNVTVSKAARGTITTDNDLSFDMNVASNFKCTPTATGALTFTNITSGQAGYILLVNTGGYAITAAATTKVGTSFLATISTAGTYLVSYFSDGTNVYCTSSGALS